MWAAIKSDFKEFVAETAEETKAVVATNSNKSVASSDDTAGTSNSNSSDAGRSWAGGALNLTANLSNLTSKASHVASNIDVKGLGSMIGGVVAPHPTSSQQHQPTTSVASAGDKNASALLAEDEEEELGWDDDDDDDLDVEDVQLDSSDAVLPAVDGDDVNADVVEKSSNQDAVTSEQASPNINKDDDTNEILAILQNKLSAVENERNELQAQHRQQTAELVELRSKVDELQRENEKEAVVNPNHEMEVQALQDEIAMLKSQLLEATTSSHSNESSLIDNREENEKLLQQYQDQITQLQTQLQSQQQTLQETTTHHSRIINESQTLIATQKQELIEAQTKSSALQSELKDMESRYHTALSEIDEKQKIIDRLEKENCGLVKEMEDKKENLTMLQEEMKNVTLDKMVTSTDQPSGSVETTESVVKMDNEEATNTTTTADAAEEEGEISSGEKINVDDSFVTAGDEEMMSPNTTTTNKNLKAALLAGEDEEEEEDDWGDEW
eukprot:scaffold72011_cov40-Cyclotella_meneghiniana.AAC.1